MSSAELIVGLSKSLNDSYCSIDYYNQKRSDAFFLPEDEIKCTLISPFKSEVEVSYRRAAPSHLVLHSRVATVTKV